MVTHCGCMCFMAGHYGDCQIDAEPGLTHSIGRLLIVPRADVCRACYLAVKRLGEETLRRNIGGRVAKEQIE
jgi:hypothetical protein